MPTKKFTPFNLSEAVPETQEPIQIGAVILKDQKEYPVYLPGTLPMEFWSVYEDAQTQLSLGIEVEVWGKRENIWKLLESISTPAEEDSTFKAEDQMSQGLNALAKKQFRPYYQAMMEAAIMQPAGMLGEYSKDEVFALYQHLSQAMTEHRDALIDEAIAASKGEKSPTPKKGKSASKGSSKASNSSSGNLEPEESVLANA